MLKKIPSRIWILTGVAVVLAAVVLIAINTRAGPDTDPANGTITAPIGQMGAGPADNPMPMPAGQTDADSADGTAATPAGQTGVGPAGNTVATPAEETDAGPADDTVTTPAGEMDAGSADGTMTTPAGETGADPADDNVTTPAGQTGVGSPGDAITTPGGQSGVGPANAAGEMPVRQADPNPVNGAIRVPPGQTEFSINLRVNEPTPYAGIEFTLALSDEDAQAFASFTPSISGASTTPVVSKDGKYYFGYYAGSNAFSAGDTLAGALNFTGYTSDKALTITVAQMSVIRVDENNKSVTTEKESPYAFKVTREKSG